MSDEPMSREQMELALNQALLGRGVTVAQVQRTYRLAYADADRLMTLREACFDALPLLDAALRQPPAPEPPAIVALVREYQRLCAVRATASAEGRLTTASNAELSLQGVHQQLLAWSPSAPSPVAGDEPLVTRAQADKWLRHTDGCESRRGRDCSCGLDEFRRALAGTSAPAPQPAPESLDAYVTRTAKHVHDTFPAWANVPSRNTAAPAPVEPAPPSVPVEIGDWVLLHDEIRPVTLAPRNDGKCCVEYWGWYHPDTFNEIRKANGVIWRRPSPATE